MYTLEATSMRLLFLIINCIVITLLSFYLGYLLRPIFSQKWRWVFGFIIAFGMYNLVWLLSFYLTTIEGLLRISIGIGLLIGFLLGIAGPPYNNKIG